MIIKKKKYIKIAFVILFIGLFFQFALSHFFVEPYPALLLPAFSNAPKSQSVFTHRALNITAYNKGKKIGIPSAQIIFDTVPPVHRTILMRKIFRPNSYVFNSPDSTSSRYYRSQNLRLQLKEYVHNNLYNYLNGKKADSLQVQWMQVETDLTNNQRDTTFTELVMLSL